MTGEKRFVEVELDQLSINQELLHNTKLRRLPTWDELFEAVHSTVQSFPPGYHTVGPAVLKIPADQRALGGRCILYAMLTWASLQLLIRNRSCPNIGGVGIKVFGGPGKKALLLPRDPRDPNASGGYHTWCMVELFAGGSDNPDPDDTLVVDFGYHWFQQAVRSPEYIPGGDCFLVGRPTTLYNAGITYHAHDASENLFNTLDLADFKDDLHRVFAYLHERIGSRETQS